TPRACVLPNGLLPADDGARGGGSGRLPIPPQRGWSDRSRPRVLPPPAALVVLQRPVVQTGARRDRALGHRQHDDHLPGSVARRSRAPVRGGRHRGRERMAEVPAHHAPHDQPGDLLHRGDRRDLRIPVLHRGLRRGGERRQRGRRLEQRSGLTAGHDALVHDLALSAAVRVVPSVLRVLFVLSTSLMTTQQALTRDLIPHPFQWRNYVDIFQEEPLLRYGWNTFVYAGLATVGVVLSSVPVAYALSVIKWRGQRAVFLLVI